MTKHTPGPWRYWPCKAEGCDSIHDYMQIASGRHLVAKVNIRTVTEADMRLIAAAPDLLAELKNLRRAYVNLLESGRDRIIFLGGQCDDVQTMEANDPHLRSSSAAVAKATGEAA